MRPQESEEFVVQGSTIAVNTVMAPFGNEIFFWAILSQGINYLNARPRFGRQDCLHQATGGRDFGGSHWVRSWATLVGEWHRTSWGRHSVSTGDLLGGARKCSGEHGESARGSQTPVEAWGSHHRLRVNTQERSGEHDEELPGGQILGDEQDDARGAFRGNCSGDVTSSTRWPGGQHYCPPGHHLLVGRLG